MIFGMSAEMVICIAALSVSVIVLAVMMRIIFDRASDIQSRISLMEQVEENHHLDAQTRLSDHVFKQANLESMIRELREDLDSNVGDQQQELRNMEKRMDKKWYDVLDLRKEVAEFRKKIDCMPDREKIDYLTELVEASQVMKAESDVKLIPVKTGDTIADDHPQEHEEGVCYRWIFPNKEPGARPTVGKEYIFVYKDPYGPPIGNQGVYMETGAFITDDGKLVMNRAEDQLIGYCPVPCASDVADQLFEILAS